MGSAGELLGERPRRLEKDLSGGGGFWVRRRGESGRDYEAAFAPTSTALPLAVEEITRQPSSPPGASS